MPTTPEQTALPYVKTEIENLRTLFSKTFIDLTVMQNPTKAEIILELPKHTIAHFACHGYPAEDPSQSSLLLDDWRTRPLTVSDLTSLNIESAKFGYLSACHTSAARDFHLMDESITLSSAIQLCGYSSVVGSLWQVMDDHSAEVARYVYEWIMKGNDGFEARRSAEGIHKAVRLLRDKTCIKLQSTMKSDPVVWASYIHIGI